ncbi:MAG: helix-turn-helix domain-containing protein [Butyrivibrio sp.]|nr:helix-turn-helix domain-containing protein [Butyrivibrio sp.]
MNDIGQYLNEVKGLFAKYENIKNFGNDDSLTDGLKNKQDELDEAILAEVDPRHIDRKSVKEFLRRGEKDEIEGFVSDFLLAMGKNVLSSTMLRQYVAMDFYFCVSEYIESELMLTKEEYENMIPAADILSDEKSTHDYLISILNKAIALRNENNPGRYSEVVKEMLEYIYEHYSDEELSLNQIAFHVNFSPNHLSAIFRQQTGQNFIKYLTDYRMEKAKELLATTSKKSNEIGLLVGYRDPHYFSYLFKKTQGITTTQYRDRSI